MVFIKFLRFYFHTHDNAKSQHWRALRRLQLTWPEVTSGHLRELKVTSDDFIDKDDLLAACKRAQQLPTCWEMLRLCWQWCANGCNNSQRVWDLQCIVGKIQPISLCSPCVMSVRGPNNVGRAVQTDPTLLRYASAITEQAKCWELLAEKFDRFQTLRNNIQQHATGCANGRNM